MEKEAMEVEAKKKANTWEEFNTNAQEFCVQNPGARYVLKFRNKENVAVLKLVSGSKVLKYKTTSAEDTIKIEDFNKFFLNFASGTKEDKSNTCSKLHRQIQKEEEKQITLITSLMQILCKYKL